MLVESKKPLTVILPGGEIHLEPGKPRDLSEDQALKLLARAKGKVRVAGQEWLAEWRALAELTSGITADDPRLQPILAALKACDQAFLAGDYLGFRQASLRVKERVRCAK